MFTGIIEKKGTLLRRKDNLFVFSNPFGLLFAVGESICLSGMCATVLRSSETEFEVEIMKQSRDITLFEAIKEGEEVNLERSAMMNQRNSGHYVTGHIDVLVPLLKKERKSDFWELWFALPAEFSGLVVKKGSVTIDGISLTVADVKNDAFSVCIISHTWEETTLSVKDEDSMAQVEFDLMGKYVLRAFEAYKK